MFVTFRLYESLPVTRVFPPGRMTSGKAFVTMDKLLDKAHGPRYLEKPDIAGMMVEALWDGERRFQRYELHS